VTATATPLPLDHFLCYEIHRPSINETGVGLSDQFFPNGTAKVRQAKRLCAPVNKNNEDPTAPSHPGHETFYTIKQTSPKFVRTQDMKDIPVAVLNDFDSDPGNDPPTNFTVDLVRVERMLVPTSKSLVGPNFPPPLNVPLDHYKCYRVRGARFRRANITVRTQFDDPMGPPLTVAIKRPRNLCVPVEKTHDNIVTPIVNNTLALMCFQVRAVPQNQRQVFTTNQFEQGAYETFGVRDLCVPAVVNPGTCGDGEVKFPEECDGQDDAACPQACDPQTCKCTQPQPACGDGNIDPGEQCESDTDCLLGCAARGGRDCLTREVGPVGPTCVDCQCVEPPVCGDGVVNQQTEECDDAPNGPSADCAPGTCLDDCTCGDPRCGDNVVNGTDECDGTATGTLCDGLCTNDCTCPVCGNDVVEPGEVCDGTVTGTACDGLCTSNCTCPVCGNGVKEPGEACDGDFTPANGCVGSQSCINCSFCQSCFTGETLVSTADGLREIRTIAVGDRVWTKDEKSGELSLQPVTQTMTRETAALRLLDVGGATIRTTDIHPFWVEGKGWTKAGEIAAGDQLGTKDGKQLTVIASTSEPQGGPIMPASLSSKPHGTTTVYDLEVANTHTFFVSPQKILVHNK
jgi:hypothetical protein